MSSHTPTAAAVVLAGGSGTRFGEKAGAGAPRAAVASENKVYLPLAGRRVVSWALMAMIRVPEIGRVVLTVRSQDRDLAAEIVDRELPGHRVDIVDGGDCRHSSEHNALRHLAADIRSGSVDTVLIHDAARPLATASLVASVIAAARRHGGAVPGVPAADLVRVDGSGTVVDGHERRQYFRVQTPQAFRASDLLRAYEDALQAGFQGTDTSACIERFTTIGIHSVLGDVCNVKVTYPQDLFLAEQILAARGYAME